MTWRKSPASLIALFDRVLPVDPRMARRQMFGYPAAFIDNKLFAGLHQDSLILRLPEEEREQLRAAHGAGHFEPMPGRRMREYVVASGSMLADPTLLRRWVKRAMAHTAATAKTTSGTGRARARPSKRARAAVR